MLSTCCCTYTGGVCLRVSEVRIDKYRFGEVRYCDCLDPTYGLPSLEDKSFELGFTDPKFNVKYKKKTEMHRNVKPYEDSMTHEEYKKWCQQWFYEYKRITYTQLIHCGKVNINMWYEIEVPYDIIYWHPQRAIPSPGKASWQLLLHPFLCYGKFGKKRFSRDIYSFPMKFKYKNVLIHSCPLNYFIVKKLIKEFRPNTILDCFLGSGTIAEICEELSIPWLGYEINEVYSQDIEKRLKNVKVEPKQKTLEVW